MAKYQDVFKRYEVKYILTREQQTRFINAFERTMVYDKYAHSTIRNIYYDTPSKLLIRRSLEKPLYKEKLRVRSYSCVDENSTVFVEIKKKFDGIVYKRRIDMTNAQAESYLLPGGEAPSPSQISREIDYFKSLYCPLAPGAFIAYDRTAFHSQQDAALRVTFDKSILWRDYDLTLTRGVYGTPLLNEDMVLMEIKAGGALPLWLCTLLDETKLCKTSFSKYGTAYRMQCNSKKERGGCCA